MTRFLVVDDSPAIRMRLALALRRAEPTATLAEAEDADAALARFERDRPDVVFLDMMLAEGAPGGLQVLRRILAARPDAHIVLLTSLPGDHPDVVAAIGHGAAAYLPKPITNEGVQRVLDQIEADRGRLGRIR